MPCRIHPSDIPSGEGSLSFAREIQTLVALQQGLGSGYCVFHSVHWTRLLDQKSKSIGEIDFIVMNRSGDLLLIEQKTGPLIEQDGELFKSYGNNSSPKSVSMQITRNRDGLVNKYRKVHNDLLITQNMLYCPDYRVIEAKLAALERNQIVDSTDAHLLCQRIISLLPEGNNTPKARLVERFLKNEFLIQDDLVRVSSANGQYTTRLASGLTQWVNRLELFPHRLRIVGTAGSGKTQLAMHALNEASNNGLKSLYVSFNRPLAKHMVEILPKSVKVISFYALCEELVRAEDAELAAKKGYLTTDVNELFELAASITPLIENQYDLLIVDEGQDFTQAQADFLTTWAKADSKVFWLEDPIQNIYFKSPVELKNWATLKVPTNYRNPKPIVDFLARMVNVIKADAGDELFCANPVDGPAIEYFEYQDKDTAQMVKSTEAAVASLLKQGFNTQNITLLTYKGQGKSELLNREKLNGFRLKKPIPNQPDEYTEGEIETDTLFRFKGLSNQAIVLTEVEFDTLTERAARLLFVGASRAKFKLCIVHCSGLNNANNN